MENSDVYSDALLGSYSDSDSDDSSDAESLTDSSSHAVVFMDEDERRARLLRTGLDTVEVRLFRHEPALPGEADTPADVRRVATLGELAAAYLPDLSASARAALDAPVFSYIPTAATAAVAQGLEPAPAALLATARLKLEELTLQYWTAASAEVDEAGVRDAVLSAFEHEYRAATPADAPATVVTLDDGRAVVRRAPDEARLLRQLKESRLVVARAMSLLVRAGDADVTLRGVFVPNWYRDHDLWLLAALDMVKRLYADEPRVYYKDSRRPEEGRAAYVRAVFNELQRAYAEARAIAAVLGRSYGEPSVSEPHELAARYARNDSAGSGSRGFQQRYRFLDDDTVDARRDGKSAARARFEPVLAQTLAALETELRAAGEPMAGELAGGRVQHVLQTLDAKRLVVFEYLPWSGWYSGERDLNPATFYLWVGGGGDRRRTGGVPPLGIGLVCRTHDDVRAFCSDASVQFFFVAALAKILSFAAPLTSRRTLEALNDADEPAPFAGEPAAFFRVLQQCLNALAERGALLVDRTVGALAPAAWSPKTAATRTRVLQEAARDYLLARTGGGGRQGRKRALYTYAGGDDSESDVDGRLLARDLARLSLQ